MQSSMWLLALTIGLLIVASAFFSSAETALTAASDARMRQLTNKGDKRAKIVEKLRADREGLIGSILIGNNAVNVLGSALATSFAIALFGEGGLVWATIGMTVLLVVFAEVMPKLKKQRPGIELAHLIGRFFTLLRSYYIKLVFSTFKHIFK